MAIIKKFLKWIGIIFGAIIFGGIALWHILILLLVIFIIVGMGIIALYDNSLTEEQRNSYTKITYRDRYHPGYETVESFGNKRRFAIEKNLKIETNEKIWYLIDRKQSKNNIEYDIKSYERVSSYVYTKGEKGYTKLNYETAEIQQNKNINEFSKEDQEIFKKLEVEKSRAIS